MSIEKNLHDVKDKLTKDQNLLVSAFKLETFYKKYKNFLFLAVALLVLFGIYMGIRAYTEHRTNSQANELMNTLYSKNLTEEDRKKTEETLATIKPDLYDFYRYTQLQNLSLLQLKSDENLAVLEQLSKSNNELVATLASYQYAVFGEKLELLEDFKSDSMPILRDRARFLAAYLYMQNNNTQKAREILESIQPRDNNKLVAEMATLLKHYGVSNQDSNTQNTDSPTKEDKAAEQGQ